MADTKKLNQAANIAGGIGGVGLSWLGSYFNTPKAMGNEGYLHNANVVGNWNFGRTDMQGLLSQYENVPTLSRVTGKDFFNPSSGEIFGSLFGAGAASYGAAKGLTDNISISPKGSNKAQAASQSLNSPSEGVYGSGIYGESDITPEDRTATSTILGTYLNGCGGHLHGCGGHKYANGGASFNWGNAIGEGINLASAGIGIGLNYLGIQDQIRKSEREAAEVNATNDYALQLMNHNFNQAVVDTKNNMFNQQALQMMAMGGDLQTQGADFPLYGDFNVIGAGGTHEQNPYGGVFQGMAMDGRPNLVEEDEVVWNDYVFSNRIKIPVSIADTYKLREGITYAEAAKKLSKEAEERPNDPISQNGLSAVLGALMQSQEETKAKKEAARVKRAISKMSPLEIMDMVAALQGAQQSQPYSMPAMQTQFARGGRMTLQDKRREDAAALWEEVTNYGTNGLSNKDIRTLRQSAKKYPDMGFPDIDAILKEDSIPVSTLEDYKRILTKDGLQAVPEEKSHEFAKGSKMTRKQKKAAKAAKEIDKYLYEARINQWNTEQKNRIASQIEGYNADDFNTTDRDAKLTKFLMDNYEKVGGHEGLLGIRNPMTTYQLAKEAPLTADSFAWTDTPSYDFTRSVANKSARQAYDKSRSNRGSNATYTYEDNLTDAEVRNREASEDYKKQTNYVLELLDKNNKGTITADEARWLEGYFTDVDKNIPISQRVKSSKVPSYLKYDEQGKVLHDANTGYALYADDIYGDAANGTAGRYYKMRNDDKWGMVHQPFVLPTENNVRTGERNLYWIKGADGNYQQIDMSNLTAEDLEKNPFLRRATQYQRDEEGEFEGNKTMTHNYYYDPQTESEQYNHDSSIKQPPLPTIGRYAPLLAGLAALQGPAKDYSTGVSPRIAHYEPIGDYLPYLPVDTQRYINAENQQAAAQLNAIMNASAGNRNMAMAQAALANQQRQQGIGQRMQAAEQINWDRLRTAGEFNRGTNMFNAQAHNQAELANLQNNHLLLRQAQRNAMMRHTADAERDAAISASANAFLDSLSGIGRENLAWNQANSNEALRYLSRPNGYSEYKAPTLSDEDIAAIREVLGNQKKSKQPSNGAVTTAFGGYLMSKPNKKNRR